MLIAELGLMNLIILTTGFVTLTAGYIIFFRNRSRNRNRDLPDLENPTRNGWALILLSGLITSGGAVAGCANHIARAA